MLDVLCISASDHQTYGCPHCGSSNTSVFSQICSTHQVGCGECKETFVMLADGIDQSAFGISVGSFQVFPRVQRHPLRGTAQILGRGK